MERLVTVEIKETELVTSKAVVLGMGEIVPESIDLELCAEGGG